MEEILVETINKENKKISKSVPKELLSLYLNSGWSIPKKEVKEIVKEEVIEKAAEVAPRAKSSKSKKYSN